MLALDLIRILLQGLLFMGLATMALLLAAIAVRGAWFNAIKPMLPDPQIDRDAAEIIASFPDPEDEASRRSRAAKCRCDWPDQMYWIRVRKAVGRRLAKV